MRHITAFNSNALMTESIGVVFLSSPYYHVVTTHCAIAEQPTVLYQFQDCRFGRTFF